MSDDVLGSLADLVAERIQHRDDDTFLTTADLAERYDCDPRTARDVARRAGAIKLGLGLQIRRDHLLAWEDEQAAAGRAAVDAVRERRPVVPRRARGTLLRGPEKLPPLEPGWWREG